MNPPNAQRTNAPAPTAPRWVIRGPVSPRRKFGTLGVCSGPVGPSWKLVRGTPGVRDWGTNN